MPVHLHMGLAALLQGARGKQLYGTKQLISLLTLALLLEKDCFYLTETEKPDLPSST